VTARRLMLVSLSVAAGLAASAAPAFPAVRPLAPSTPWSARFVHAPGGALATVAEAPAVAARPGGGVGRVPVGPPQTVALSRALHTVYVSGDTDVVSVIDAHRCNARRTTGCDAPVATMHFDPTGTADVAVDDRSLTGYVSNPALGTVSVFDAARCNARTTSGCMGAHASVTTGGAPIGLAVDQATRTLYVGNVEAFVSVIDIRACNRVSAGGCTAAPTQIATRPGPAWLTVDDATDTLYAPEQGPEEGPPGDTVAVIDGATCNASVVTGCGRTPARATTGSGASVAVADPRTRTLYVENQDALTVSVLDAATCNARDATDCAPQAAVQVGNEPNSSLVIDQPTRTLFVVNTGSDTLSVVDLRHCRAGDVAGCAQPDRTLQTGGVPFWIELDPRTRTMYVPEHLDEDVAAIGAAGCNALRRSGCRHEAPTAPIPDGVFATAADPRTHTLYAGAGDSGKLTLRDTRRCRAGRTRGCDDAPFEFQLADPAGSRLNDFVLDRRTRTLYAVDTVSSRLFVLDTDGCNFAVRDCAPRATVPTEAGPFALALNRRTRTLYVANFDGGSVTLLDAAHCNAADTGGCTAAPTTVPLDGNPNAVAVDPGSDTAYVSAFGAPIAVLHGAGRAGTLATQAQTIGLGLDASTHTLYVADFLSPDFEDAPGRVAIVDTRVCNGLERSGCDRTWPTTPVGRGPWAVAVDPARHRVFTGNFLNATASVIDGTRCNAISLAGCDRTWPRVAIGNITLDLELAQRDHTLYASNAPDREVSVIDSDRPCRRTCVP
jgi:DNA-binding beta-propeller fold protein YncE